MLQLKSSAAAREAETVEVSPCRRLTAAVSSLPELIRIANFPELIGDERCHYDHRQG